MNSWTGCPGFESFPNFDDSTAFEEASSTFVDNNNTFTTITGQQYYGTAPGIMAYEPVTPASHSSGRATYSEMYAGCVTPQAHQHIQLNNYPAGFHGLSFSQTPMSGMMHSFGGPVSAMHAPVQAAPALNFRPYIADSQSYSDSNDMVIAANTPTPTPQARNIPTPTQSPQSPQDASGNDMDVVPPSHLKYDTFEEAEAEASGRYPLRVQDDDWKAIETDKKVHVAAIMAAFDADFKLSPKMQLSVTEKLRWVKYQTEQNDKVAKYLAKFPRAKELSAWMLLEALIDAHKLGCKKGIRVTDNTKCCSFRFADMVKAIRQYAVIRFDLVRMQRLDELATSPTHCIARKVANWRGNAGKIKRDEANKEIAAAAGVQYKNVLGDKRKYKPLEPTFDYEDDDEEQGNEDTSGFETPLSSKQANKRKAGDEDSDDGEFNLSGTPSKSARKTTVAPTNKRAKRITVVAGPDPDN